MTEKEKAAKGMLYNANFDKQLLEERNVSKSTIYEYNNLHPLNYERKNEIIKRFLGDIGKNFIIEQPFLCDYGYNIFIGDNFYSNSGLNILDGAKVCIGNNVFIAPDVGIYTAGHPFNIKERSDGLEYAYPITIGNNVWIGAKVCILPGVSIGNNTVIGAGSVVNKSIPDNVLAAGNPCKVIRIITDEDKKKYR